MAIYGAGSYITVKKETSYKTEATTGATTYKFISEGLVWEPVLEDNPEIGSGGLGKVVPTQVAQKALGPVNMLARFENIAQVMFAIFGAAYSETADGTSQTHIWTPQTTQPSFTIEKKVGAISGVWTFVGMTLNSLGVTVPEKGHVTLNLDWMGADETSAGGGDTANGSGRAADADYPVRASYAKTMTLHDGADNYYCLKNFSLNINRGNNGEDFCVGSATPAQPNSDAPLEVSGEFEVILLDRVHYDSYKAITQAVVEILFEGVAILGGNGKKWTWGFNMPTALLKSPGGMPTVDKQGRLTIRVPYEAYGSGGTTYGGAKPISGKTITMFTQATF